jgi:hypothetical protein
MNINNPITHPTGLDIIKLLLFASLFVPVLTDNVRVAWMFFEMSGVRHHVETLQQQQGTKL